MHVVVTGAAGFIGSHTCEALVARGHRVTGIDSFDSYLYPAAIKRATAKHLLATLGEPFELVEADIADADAMAMVCGAGDVDVVCHLAALAGVRPSLEQPLRYIRTNLEGTTAILEAMRHAGHKRLVFASSSSVYGSKGEGVDLKSVEPFREDDPCLRPASPYAATKRAGELLCSNYRDLFGIGVASLRFFTVYGPRQRPDMAIHKFVKAISAGQPITLFGDGSSRRDYTYIDDIVAGTVAAIERVEPGKYTVYNLGGTSTISLAELVQTIEDVLGKKAEIDRQPMQPGDVPITYADIENSARDLDYSPSTGVRDGIEKFWTWYQDQPSS
ncbi:MAG: NAD-dependent epimerase/dehydratase family protein [Deltaproteobacteria bacterium]|nr:NAD-dependent epimerase/dehydratase family protein [Deltaproteobacteria bacterium]